MHFPISKTSCSLLYTEFYSKGEYGEIIWRFNPVWVWKLNLYYLYSQVWVLMGFTGGSVVKNPPANAGDWGRPLGWEDPLKKEMATHSSILASVHEKSHGQRSLADYCPCCCKGVRHDLVTKQQQQQWILIHLWILYNIQFSSVAQSCLTLCDPMNCSTTGLPVHHQLLESVQIHVRWVSDAIQQSHPLSSPSPPALNLSQHQGFFEWVSSLHQVAKVLDFQLQHLSFQWTPGLISFRMDWLDLLAVQGTLKSLLQHQSSKALILQAQLSL